MAILISAIVGLSIIGLCTVITSITNKKKGESV